MVDKFGVHYNPSTLKAQYDSSNKKLIVTSYEYGSDCCCFLDTSVDEWSSVVTYNMGDEAWLEWATYRSKVDNNLNHSPSSSPDWWTKISDTRECGNSDWNKYAPTYGGYGKTPKYLTVKFSGIGGSGGLNGWPYDPPGPNRSFVLSQLTYEWGHCDYTCITPHSILGRYAVGVYLFYGKYLPYRYYQIVLRSLWYSTWAIGCYYVENEYVDQGGDSKWRCKQNHTSTAENKPPVDGDNDYWEDIGIGCDDDWCGCLAFAAGSSSCEIGVEVENELSSSECSDCEGTAIVKIGRKLTQPWTLGENYSMGDSVVGTGGLYVCKQNHTATINDKPETGANWASYWNYSTGCNYSWWY